MAKAKTRYVCQQCGYSQTGWSGKCPECESWGSLVETVSEAGSKKSSSKNPKAVTKSLSSIKAKDSKRKKTKISELDRVLGGGLVPGQVVLIAGEPGIGKSTILMQASDALAGKGKEMLYVSGEESLGQIKLRAERLKVDNKHISLIEETNIEAIIQIIENKKGELGGVIIDSIQTMYTSDLSGMAGSAGQVREVSYRLVRVAKALSLPVFIVGHITKEGSVAGPALLMHIVDTVLWFEGDRDLSYRMLRAHKNRFGPTDEVGIFSMQDKGLASIKSPEKIFLSDRKDMKPGIAVSAAMQGTRPILVEVQTLVVSTKMAFPRRITQGVDAKRFEILLAVLTKRAGLRLNDYDCYLNIAGGISVKDPAIDLAVCLSLASSYFEKALPRNTVAIGEVGLLGDIRSTIAQSKRTKEASRLGYAKALTNTKYDYIDKAIKNIFNK